MASKEIKASLTEKWNKVLVFRKTVSSLISNPRTFFSSANDTISTAILSFGQTETPEEKDVEVLSGQILILQQIVLSFFIFYNWFFIMFYNPLRGENISIPSWKGGDDDSVFVQLGRFCFKLGFDLIVMLQSTILFKAPTIATEYKLSPELLAVLTFVVALFFSIMCLEAIFQSFSSLAEGKTDAFAGVLYGVAVAFFFITLISPEFLFNAYSNPSVTGVSVCARLLIGLLIWVPLGGTMFFLYLFFISFFAILYYSPYGFFSTIKYTNDWIKGTKVSECKECDSLLPESMLKNIFQFISGNLFPLSICGYLFNGIRAYATDLINPTAKPLLIIFNTAMIATISVRAGWV